MGHFHKAHIGRPETTGVITVIRSSCGFSSVESENDGRGVDNHTGGGRVNIYIHDDSRGSTGWNEA